MRRSCSVSGGAGGPQGGPAAVSADTVIASWQPRVAAELIVKAQPGRGAAANTQAIISPLVMT